MIDCEVELSELNLPEAVLGKIQGLVSRSFADGMKCAIGRFATKCPANDLCSAITFLESAKPKAIILGHDQWERVLNDLGDLSKDTRETICIPDGSDFPSLNIRGVPVYIDAGIL